MKIAFIIFNDITWLDLIGAYDPISRLKKMSYLPGLSWDFCSFTEVTSDHYGACFRPTKIQSSLKDYDMIYVPGGYGTLTLLLDQPFIKWLQTAESVPLKVSVCTGSILLGAAGFLKNNKATTHFSEFETLKRYCREVSNERIVDDAEVITAGAVSSSIDLGLYLCKKWVSEKAAREISERMAYRYDCNF